MYKYALSEALLIPERDRREANEDKVFDFWFNQMLFLGGNGSWHPSKSSGHYIRLLKEEGKGFVK